MTNKWSGTLTTRSEGYSSFFELGLILFIFIKRQVQSSKIETATGGIKRILMIRLKVLNAVVSPSLDIVSDNKCKTGHNSSKTTTRRGPDGVSIVRIMAVSLIKLARTKFNSQCVPSISVATSILNDNNNQNFETEVSWTERGEHATVHKGWWAKLKIRQSKSQKGMS